LKGKRIELTAQERELLMLNSSDDEAEQQDPNEVLIQRRMRDEKDLKRNGLLPGEPEQDKYLRTRRVKNKNFHVDYVYDDKTIKETIAFKNSAAQQQPEQKSSTLKPPIKKVSKKYIAKQSTKMISQEVDIKKVNEKKLYCLCKTEDESQNMICCDKCQEWYHFECVGVDIVRNKFIFRAQFKTSTNLTMSAPSARKRLKSN
jgi:hypothetical protein